MTSMNHGPDSAEAQQWWTFNWKWTNSTEDSDLMKGNAARISLLPEPQKKLNQDTRSHKVFETLDKFLG